MRPSSRQLLRALRVLLACLTLTLLTAPFAPGRGAMDTVVLVAQASSATHESATRTTAHEVATKVSRIEATWSAPTRATRVTDPGEVPQRSSPRCADTIGEDLYLHNCVLLR
ncbi:hypothetical protein [Chondromyces crocatus]|uniref:Secreted protein n=1 Tax=Chondromyces crocatus TaxID=52 RepID=A0A0K1E9Z9_CHOCO|nr:hypothetical protein [Chondromyces crocatus]AKT37669.1 uncharacterized protein CMC5_018110 [Chondromyces crocatus]